MNIGLLHSGSGKKLSQLEIIYDSKQVHLPLTDISRNEVVANTF